MKRFFSYVFILLAVLLGWLCSFCNVSASPDNSRFSVQCVPGNRTVDDSLVAQITVTNNGKDFEGTVRLRIEERYDHITAYDTVLALPAGSTKQFSVTIPAITLSSDSSQQNSEIFILDKKKKVLYEENMGNRLFTNTEFISLGILSDDYASLTYLDLGGNSLYYSAAYHPILLSKLEITDIKNQLADLTFLVIDRFDTSVLSSETVDAISDWVQSGGTLVIGTGAYGDQIFASYEFSQMVGATVVPNTAGNVIDPYNNLYEANFDYAQMPLCALNFNNSYNDYAYLGMSSSSRGQGAIAVTCYALTDLNGLSYDAYYYGDRTQIAQEILDMAASDASARYRNSGSSYYDNNNYLSNLLNLLNNLDNKLHFGLLYLVLICYILLLSPLAYLFLKKKKIQERYWIYIPVLSLVFIFLIFLTGNGLAVVSTKVYSVSVMAADGSSKKDSYLYCYGAKSKFWKVRLQDDMQLAGSVSNGWYNSNGLQDFRYAVIRDADRLSIGFNPVEPFDEALFYAQGENPECGQLVFTDLSNIVNRTGKDFAYVAVCSPYDLYIYPALKNGEALDVNTAVPILYDSLSGDISRAYSCFRSEYADLLSKIDEHKKPKLDDPCAVAALGCGLSALTVGDNSSYVYYVIGVIPDYKPVTDGNSEKSYGCLYNMIEF